MVPSRLQGILNMPSVFLALALFPVGCSHSEAVFPAIGLGGLSASNKSKEVADPGIARRNSRRAPIGSELKRKGLSNSNVKSFPASADIHHVSLNRVPIATAAQLILHDKLGFPVQIDTDVAGEITLEARNGIASDDLMRLFGTALRDSGANLTISGGVAIIRGGPVFPMPRHENGAGISVLQLNHISANDFVDLVSGMIGSSLQLRADAASNAIIVSGPSITVEGLLDLAKQMDQAEWRYASYALVPVDPDSAESTAKLVSEVFAGSAAPSIKLRYIASLSSLWVIGVSDLAIERAKQVIRQFEQFAVDTKPQRFVWPLKSADATDMVDLLESFLSTPNEQGTQAATVSSSDVGFDGFNQNDETSDANRVDATQVNSAMPQESGRYGADQSAPSNAPAGPQKGMSSKSDLLARAGSRSGAQDTLLVADQETNSLVFEITPQQWRRVLPLLLDLDRPVKQIHISVTILEIALTDSLSFGLQHALSFGDFQWVVSTTPSPVLAPALPGLAISLDSSKLDIFLNQLEKTTHVAIVSTPNLMVQHGEQGQIKVGDQVPTLLGTTTDGSRTEAYYRTQIEYRSTGLTLDVTPFVDGRDQVNLQVNASYDNASRNKTSGIDSPVIEERSVKTIVTSRHNQTIILGGLRRRTKENAKSKIPLFKRLPMINRVLGSTSRSSAETELLILLTPRVVSGLADIDNISRSEIDRVVSAYDKLARAR